MTCLSFKQLRVDMVFDYITQGSQGGFPGSFLNQNSHAGYGRFATGNDFMSQVVSCNDDTLVAMRALESGALLFIKKHAAMEIYRSLWQHVLREKARFVKLCDTFQEVTETEKIFKGRRECTDWTPKLHAKFMNDVRLLGEGSCFPKEILNLMNVDGLTRLQLASGQPSPICWNNQEPILQPISI